jgi:hypothetical protein
MSWLAKIPLAILGLLILLAVGRIFFFGGERGQDAPDTSSIERQEEGVGDESTETTVIEPVETPEGASPSNPNSATQTTKKATPEDCERECEGFSTLPDEQAYCFSFCGLSQEGYQGKDCATLPSREKDFCFKEQAIRERNAETCARIGESSLRKVCEARIAEELFD